MPHRTLEPRSASFAASTPQSPARIACVVGARPNFMKMAPILHALRERPALQPTLVHTGQHYDANLSDVFFQQLRLPQPDVCLEVGSGTHAQQTARILERFEQVLLNAARSDAPFDWVLVVGDVNSTLAAALAAVKLGVRVAHVEAGLRSRDRAMPEEINRLMTDSVCDLLLASEPDGMANLLHEGHPAERVHLVGNVMIDTLFAQLDAARALPQLTALDVVPHQYLAVTLHRPANVDDPRVLAQLVDLLVELSAEVPVVFPIHPRTAARLAEFGLAERLERARGVRCLPPLGYREFLCVSSQAKAIVTDSGGLQEEATVLGIPCLTMRPTTERPITVTEGTSTLVGSDVPRLREHLADVLAGTYKTGHCPALWDGQASQRIVDVLARCTADVRPL